MKTNNGQKQKRIIDRKLLDFIKNEFCLVCRRWPSDPSHVTSVGAGGHDTIDNVMPLCRGHHREWHATGRFTFLAKHTVTHQWLKNHGREDILAKLEEPKNDRTQE